MEQQQEETTTEEIPLVTGDESLNQVMDKPEDSAPAEASESEKKSRKQSGVERSESLPILTISRLQEQSPEPKPTTETPGQSQTTTSLSILARTRSQLETCLCLLMRPDRKTQFWVRRLTPMENERLQGFPDGWTILPTHPDTGH